MGARTGRYGVGAVLALALGLSVLTPTAQAAQATQATPMAQAGTENDPGPVVGSESLRIVHANLLTTMKAEKFQRDARTVTSLGADVITYNEVPFRYDTFLAPDGYALYRDTRNRFTAATPVAWRTDRWTAIATGNRWLSNWRGKPPGRVVELGRRTANWVTLQGADGRVISVVSVHIAPPTRGMPDLLRRSVKKLNKLVRQLAASGPVLVGGDFNVHYRSGRYPRDLFDAGKLAPTFDLLGTYFPTGDHFGHTIDYVFVRGEGKIAPTAHHAVELRSDHDAVVGDLGWLVDAPTTISTTSNDPAGTKAEQRAVVKGLMTAIDRAAPGATVALRAPALDLFGVQRSLRRALGRGVHVQVMTANDTATRHERKVERAILAHGDPDSWVQACGAGCLPAWRAAGMPRSLLMVSNAAGAWIARYDANRTIAADLITRRSWIKVQVGPIALDGGAALLAGGAG